MASNLVGKGVEEADFEDFSEGLPMKGTRNINRIPKTAISQAQADENKRK